MKRNFIKENSQFIGGINRNKKRISANSSQISQGKMNSSRRPVNQSYLSEKSGTISASKDLNKANEVRKSQNKHFARLSSNSMSSQNKLQGSFDQVFQTPKHSAQGGGEYILFDQEPIMEMEVESPSMSTPGKSGIKIPSPQISVNEFNPNGLKQP